MGQLKPDKSYDLQNRINKIPSGERGGVMRKLEAKIERNRLWKILNMRLQDITLTEALFLSNVLRCKPEELADPHFEFQLDTDRVGVVQEKRKVSWKLKSGSTIEIQMLNKEYVRVSKSLDVDSSEELKITLKGKSSIIIE